MNRKLTAKNITSASPFFVKPGTTTGKWPKVTLTAKSLANHMVAPAKPYFTVSRNRICVAMSLLIRPGSISMPVMTVFPSSGLNSQTFANASPTIDKRPVLI